MAGIQTTSVYLESLMAESPSGCPHSLHKRLELPIAALVDVVGADMYGLFWVL